MPPIARSALMGAFGLRYRFGIREHLVAEHVASLPVDEAAQDRRHIKHAPLIPAASGTQHAGLIKGTADVDWSGKADPPESALAMLERTFGECPSSRRTVAGSWLGAGLPTGSMALSMASAVMTPTARRQARTLAGSGSLGRVSSAGNRPWCDDPRHAPRRMPWRSGSATSPSTATTC